jgi:hypothetical protein
VLLASGVTAKRSLTSYEHDARSIASEDAPREGTPLLERTRCPQLPNSASMPGGKDNKRAEFNGAERVAAEPMESTGGLRVELRLCESLRGPGTTADYILTCTQPKQRAHEALGCMRTTVRNVSARVSELHASVSCADRIGTGSGGGRGPKPAVANARAAALGIVATSSSRIRAPHCTHTVTSSANVLRKAAPMDACLGLRDHPTARPALNDLALPAWLA